MESPTTLCATTLMVYTVPLCSPLSTVLVAVAGSSSGVEPLLGTAVTVYPVTGGLLSGSVGGVHVTVMDEPEVAGRMFTEQSQPTKRTSNWLSANSSCAHIAKSPPHFPGSLNVYRRATLGANVHKYIAEECTEIMHKTVIHHSGLEDVQAFVTDCVESLT